MNMNNWIEKLECLTEVLGAETVAEEICRAIGSVEADKTLSYIIRMWGIDEEEDEEDNEE